MINAFENELIVNSIKKAHEGIEPDFKIYASNYDIKVWGTGNGGFIGFESWLEQNRWKTVALTFENRIEVLRRIHEKIAELLDSDPDTPNVAE